MPTRAQSLKEVFLGALAVAPPERAAWLDQACSQDVDLRRQVEQMLAAHDSPQSLLDQPLLAATPSETATATPSEALGTMIGQYKLLEQIGEGGFGVVYLAEQTEPVRRKVALKILKPGMDTRQIVARFEAERQALAIMDHPNIAKVFDGGSTKVDASLRDAISGRGATGLPYFVMELVKGVPITDYCDQNHLTPRQRLELFIPVCQAVQHAHQKGIIHRDLKPSNVLVTRHDSTPVPKVIDFGVAKALGQELTDNTLFTGIAQMIGTPLYMSPEQAGMSDLDVDTRSDIYSLGVLLYELLTGTTPFEKERFKKAAYDEIRRIIREEEPPKPSTRLSDLSRSRLPGGTSESPARQAGPTSSLASVSALRQTEPAKLTKLVRGELDWIVMKALEKDRNRRYETANGFAMDVQRYLADEAVLACPPSVGYRLRKFVRRNKGQVIAAGLVLFALLAGIAGTTWGLFEAKSQERLAEQAAEEERQAKVREAQRADGEQKAKLQADEKRMEAERNLAFARKGNQILGSVFAGLDPKKIAESGRPLQDVLRENLTAAVKELEGSAIGDPLEVAEMQNTLGLSLVALGEAALAVEVLQKALNTHKTKLGPDDPNTLRCMNNLANGYLDAGRLDLAVPLSQETLKLMKAKLGPDHRDTLASMSVLAEGYREAGKLDLALPLLGENLKLTKAKFGPDHRDTLTRMDNLALGYQAAGKLDLALPLFEETFKLTKAKVGPDDPDTFASMNNLALGYLDAGKLDLAMPLLEETLKLAKAKLGPDHPHTLISMDNLARGYQAAGKLDLALPLFEETLKLRKARHGPDHPATLISMNNLAAWYQDAGNLDLAVPLFEETFKLMKAKLGPDHPHTLSSMNNLAVSYRDARKLNLALPLLEQTLKLRKAKLGPDHPATLSSMHTLAKGYLDARKLNLALALYEETLKLRKAKLGPDHRDTLRSMHDLAGCYWWLRRLDKSVPLFEEVLPLQEKKLGRAHPETQTTVANLGVNYRDAGKLDLALPLFEETLKLRRAQFPPDHPIVLTSIDNLAAGYLGARKPDLALPLYEEMLKLRKDKFGPDHRAALRSMNDLGTCYWSLRRLDKSVPLFEELLPLQEKRLGRYHTDTLVTVANLGMNFKDAGQVAKAIPLLEEAYTASKKHAVLRWVGMQLLDAYAKAGRPAKAAKLIDELLADARKTLPKDSPQLAGQLAQFGSVLMETEQHATAEQMLRECLAIREKKQPDAWSTFNTQSMLGGSLLSQKKYKDAEPLLLKGYEGMKDREKTIPPQAGARIPEALDRLTELYTATDKPEEAKKWRAERAKYPNVAPPPREKK